MAPADPDPPPTPSAVPEPRPDTARVPPQAQTLPPVGLLLTELGKLLSRCGPSLTVAVDDLETIGRKLRPVWNQLTGLRALDQLADQIEALRGAAEALQAQRGAPEAGPDPYASAMQEKFEHDLARRVEQTLHHELKPVLQALEGLRAPSGWARGGGDALGPASSRPFGADPHPDLQAVKADAARARAETMEARQELTAAAQETARVRADATLLHREAERLREELGQWRQAALGPELAQDESCRTACDDLVTAARRSVPAALGLLGTLMAVQSAPADRLPNLLKDLGEAYYAWRPRTHPGPPDDDPMEAALIRSSLARCEKLSVRNRIEVVRPNARFNSDKHRSEAGGGTMVTEVRGWVVARENGQTLHRATVLAK